MPWTDEERRAYHREFQKKKRYTRNRRLAYIDGKSCEWCGSTEKLEFHHRDKAQKSVKITQVWAWSEERRLAELAKCDLICKKCHMAHHAAEKRINDHGTRAMYAKGCRCDACREAENESQRERRAKRKARLRAVA